MAVNDGNRMGRLVEASRIDSIPTYTVLIYILTRVVVISKGLPSNSIQC